MSLMKQSVDGLIDMVQSLPNANLANGSLGVNAAARLQTTTAANVSGSIVSGATRAGRACFFGSLGPNAASNLSGTAAGLATQSESCGEC